MIFLSFCSCLFFPFQLLCHSRLWQGLCHRRWCLHIIAHRVFDLRMNNIIIIDTVLSFVGDNAFSTSSNGALIQSGGYWVLCRCAPPSETQFYVKIARSKGKMGRNVWRDTSCRTYDSWCARARASISSCHKNHIVSNVKWENYHWLRVSLYIRQLFYVHDARCEGF